MHPSQNSEQYPLHPLLHPCDPILLKYMDHNPELKQYIQGFLQFIHEDIQRLLHEKKISHIELIKTHFHDCVMLLFKHTCSSTDFEKDFEPLEEKYIFFGYQHGLLQDQSSMMEQFIIDHEMQE